jgi:hypothetical protein
MSVGQLAGLLVIALLFWGLVFWVALRVVQ